MAKNRESNRLEILEQLVEAGELYLHLDDYVKAHKTVKIPRGKNRENIEPQLDVILLKLEVWDKIKELVQNLQLL